MLRLSLRNVRGPQAPPRPHLPRGRASASAFIAGTLVLTDIAATVVRRALRGHQRRRRRRPCAATDSSSVAARAPPAPVECRLARRRRARRRRRRRRRGAVGGYAQLVDHDGEPIDAPRARRPSACPGADEADAAARDARPTGRAPDGRDEVVIDRGTAEDGGFTVGDRTTVLLADGAQPERRGRRASPPSARPTTSSVRRLAAFTSTSPAGCSASTGEVDSIDVVADAGRRPRTSSPTASRRRCPTGVEAVTGAELTDEQQDERRAASSTSSRRILLGFAGIALFVVGFIINNTFSIVVGAADPGARPAAGPRCPPAPGHCVGRRSRRLVVGVLASVARASGSAWSSPSASRRSSGCRVRPPRPRASCSRPGPLVAAPSSDSASTLVASLAPARRASRDPAGGGHARGLRPSARRPARAGPSSASSLTGVGAALVVPGSSSPMPTMTVVRCSASALCACSSASPSSARWSPCRSPAPLADRIAPLFHMTGRLAHANAVRNPDRTAKTASALMIGLALVTTVFIVGNSMKRTFAASIENSVSADYVLSTEGSSGSALHSPRPRRATGDRCHHRRALQPLPLRGPRRDLVAADGTPPALSSTSTSSRAASTTSMPTSIFIHEDPARDLGLDGRRPRDGGVRHRRSAASCGWPGSTPTPPWPATT